MAWFIDNIQPAITVFHSEFWPQFDFLSGHCLQGKVFRQEYSPLRINTWTSFCGELSLYNDQSPWLVSNPRTLLVPSLNILVVAELFLFYFIFVLQWTPLAAYGNCALLHFYIPLLPSFKKKKKIRNPTTKPQTPLQLCFSVDQKLRSRELCWFRQRAGRAKSYLSNPATSHCASGETW